MSISSEQENYRTIIKVSAQIEKDAQFGWAQMEYYKNCPQSSEPDWGRSVAKKLGFLASHKYNRLSGPRE